MTLVCILWLRATLSSLRFFLFFFIAESLAALFVPLASSPNDCLGWRPWSFRLWLKGSPPGLSWAVSSCLDLGSLSYLPAGLALDGCWVSGCSPKVWQAAGCAEHKGGPLRLAAWTSLRTLLILCASSGLWLTVGRPATVGSHRPPLVELQVLQGWSWTRWGRQTRVGTSPWGSWGATHILRRPVTCHICIWDWHVSLASAARSTVWRGQENWWGGLIISAPAWAGRWQRGWGGRCQRESMCSVGRTPSSALEHSAAEVTCTNLISLSPRANPSLSQM